MSMNEILRADGANQGGIFKLHLALEKNVISIPDAIDGIVADDIVMDPGKSFVEIQFPEETAKFFEPIIGENGGQSFEYHIDFTIAKDRAAVGVAMNNLIGQRFIAIYQDANGKIKIAGSKLQPLRLVKGDGDTGDAGATRNQRTFSLIGNGNQKSFFYSGGIQLDLALRLYAPNKYLNVPTSAFIFGNQFTYKTEIQRAVAGSVGLIEILATDKVFFYLNYQTLGRGKVYIYIDSAGFTEYYELETDAVSYYFSDLTVSENYLPLWNYLVIKYDGANLTIKVNDILLATLTQTLSLEQSSAIIRLLQNHDDLRMDNTMFYSRATTDTEDTETYNRIFKRFPNDGLEAFYTYNQTPSTIVKDNSGNDRDATIVNVQPGYDENFVPR